MPRRKAHGQDPNWDLLCQSAMSQGGYFTTIQAASSGYSRALIQYHLKQKKIERVQRGIYRLVHYPLGDRDDLIITWLWSKGEGIFSHYTALSLHELSDALPPKQHITLPLNWQRRRIQIPPGIVLHYASISPSETSWNGCIPVTSPLRTLSDSLTNHLPWDLIKKASIQGIEWGFFTLKQFQNLVKNFNKYQVINLC